MKKLHGIVWSLRTVEALAGIGWECTEVDDEKLINIGAIRLVRG